MIAPNPLRSFRRSPFLGETPILHHKPSGTTKYEAPNLREDLATLLGLHRLRIVEKKMLKTPGGARSDDLVICTKPLGLEVAVNLALMEDFG